MSIKKYIQEHRTDFDELKVSEQTDALFAEKLKTSLHTPKKGRVIPMRWLSVAASILLVVSTIFWVASRNQQQQEFKQQIIANLEDGSAGKRLEGVYDFEDAFKKEDQQIIDILIKKLLNDSNSNVKIAAIEALLKFPKNETIRKSIIKALEKETEPLVQIKLIKSVDLLRDKRAQKPLEKMIESNETYPIVKSNATLAINNLKQ